MNSDGWLLQRYSEVLSLSQLLQMAIVMPLTRFWMGAASRSGELLYLIDELDCSYGSCERCLLLSRGYSRSTGNRKELACTLINIFIMHSNEFLIGDNLELESFFRQNVNALKEESNIKRKQAIQNIYNKLSDPNIAQSDGICQQILLRIGKELLKVFSDSAEKCREFAIKSVKKLLENCEFNEPILPYLMAVLVERSNCTDLEGIQHLPEVMRPPPSQLPQVLIKFVEQSEEVRLQLVDLLFTIVSTNDSDNLHEFVDEVVDIHRAFLLDPYSEVQKAACKSLIKFCQVNHQMLLHFTEKMARAVLHPLIAKKSPLRLAALDALSAVLQCGVWKHNAFVFEILTGFRDPNSVPIKAFYEPMHNINYLATLIIDPKAQVREAFLKHIGHWLTKLADKWDHHARLVPYLLSGLFDTEASIQSLALQIIEEVGKEWEIEKEKEIKDVQQLGVHPPWTMGGRLVDLKLPPPFKQRPRIGSKGFIKSQVRKMWPALYKEIVDHTEENRLRASSLILMGTIFSEDYMTQFLDNFIPSTLIGIKPGQTKVEKQILQNMRHTYEMIGRFCDYQSYQFIIFNLVKGKFIRDDQFIRSALIGLESLCRGALEATLEGLGQKMNLVSSVIQLISEKDQLEQLTSSNVSDVEALVTTLIELVDSKATETEKQEFYKNHAPQLNLIVNVINYIQNFTHILLGSLLDSKIQKIVRNPLKERLLKCQFSQLEMIYGDHNWKNLISEFVYEFENPSISYGLTDQIIIQIRQTELPEAIDFVFKLLQLLQSEIVAPHHLQNFLALAGNCSDWVLGMKKPTPKLMDLLLQNQRNISLILKSKRELGKKLAKDQISLKNYTLLLNSTIQQAPKFYRKQQLEILYIILAGCELFLPYPSSKLLFDGKDHLIDNLAKFTFDCIDILGDNPKVESRKAVFQTLAYVNQFVPTTAENFYSGDAHTLVSYSDYLKQLIQYTIEEKDFQYQELYKIMLKDLLKKTKQNFIIELEQAKKNGQLSRAQLLQVLVAEHQTA